MIRLTNLHSRVLAKHAHCGRVEAPHQIVAKIAAVDDGVYRGRGGGGTLCQRTKNGPLRRAVQITHLVFVY